MFYTSSDSAEDEEQEPHHSESPEVERDVTTSPSACASPMSPLDDAAPEELKACIELLALSLVQCQEKLPLDPLQESTFELEPLADLPPDANQHRRQLDIAEDALEYVRIKAARAHAIQAEEEAALAEQQREKRRHLRICVNSVASLIWPGESEPVEAQLENISWGGATLRVQTVNVTQGRAIQILLPTVKGAPMQIEGKVLRSWELDDEEGFGVAVRFVKLSTKDERQLEKALNALIKASDHDGNREHARVTQPVHLEFDDSNELKAVLEDISMGGMRITLPDPLTIGQSLQTVVSTLDNEFSVKLRARVVRQEPVDYDKHQFYKVGLKLEHPMEELAEITKELLKSMSATNQP